MMKRLHIIGRKNHGKTTLVVDLVREFRRRGRRIATIKHTHHSHELDTPGKDSHQHRIAGADAVGIISRGLSAVFWEADQTDESPEGQYAQFESLFSNFDILLVEGDSETTAPKIEVWRSDCGTDAIASHDSSVLAIVTDDDIELPIETLPRYGVGEIADWIERMNR